MLNNKINEWSPWTTKSIILAQNFGYYNALAFQIEAKFKYRQNEGQHITELQTVEIIYSAHNQVQLGPSSVDIGLDWVTNGEMKKFRHAWVDNPNPFSVPINGETAVRFSKTKTIKHELDGSIKPGTANLYALVEFRPRLGSEVDFIANKDGTWKFIDLSGTDSNGHNYIPKLKPLNSAPTKGNIQINSATKDTINFSYSGFNFLNPAGHYEIKIDGVTDGWINNDLKTTYIQTGLKPETIYTIQVKAIDSYGLESDIAISQCTTAVEKITPQITMAAVTEVTNDTATILYQIEPEQEFSSMQFEIHNNSHSLEPVLIQSSNNKNETIITKLLSNTQYGVSLISTSINGLQSDPVYLQLKTQHGLNNLYIKANGKWVKGNLNIKTKTGWCKS